MAQVLRFIYFSLFVEANIVNNLSNILFSINISLILSESLTKFDTSHKVWLLISSTGLSNKFFILGRPPDVIIVLACSAVPEAILHRQ